MAKMSSLGKGLSALLGDDEEHLPVYTQESASGVGYKQVSLSLLVPNPDQPRKEFDEEALGELAASIKEHGVIQPILVEKLNGGTYKIIAGERRYRASKLAGLKEIPVVIKDQLPENKLLELALIENIQREDLSPVEEAMAYKNLMELSGLSQEEVAGRVGKKRSTVANCLRLLKLPEEMRKALEEGSITAGHARAILSLENALDMRYLYSRILSENLSVREAEAIAIQVKEGKNSVSKEKKEDTAKNNKPILDSQLKDFEQRMINFFGTKVAIKGDLNKGKIEIEYYSMDDLQRVYDLLNQ